MTPPSQQHHQPPMEAAEAYQKSLMGGSGVMGATGAGVHRHSDASSLANRSGRCIPPPLTTRAGTTTGR
jgi:hypothetical protein